MRSGYKGFIKLATCMVMLVVVLVGCSKKETETVYYLSMNGADITVTYYAKGDIVTKQTTYSVVPYSVVGATTIEEAKEVFDPIAEAYQGIEGVEESIEYKDDHAVETLVVDYSKADLEQVSKLSGSKFEGDTNGKVSLKKSIKLLEDSGFTKAEDK